MDIKVKSYYYYLHMISGKWVIFLREDVVSPMLKMTQTDVKFDDEEEAKEYVERMNKEHGEPREVTI